jgi:hypothetical protein
MTTPLPLRFTAPLDDATCERLRSRARAAGGTKQLSREDGCPVAEGTLRAALAGNDMRLAQRMALKSWLDAKDAAQGDAASAA